MTFKIRKFEDKPRYCRVPIFFGGERQIHIMQPFNEKKDGAGPEPEDDVSWFSIAFNTGSGQVVLSLEAVEDFIAALRSFAKEVKKND